MKSAMPNLQILRFVAAALVLVSHVQHEVLKGRLVDLANYTPWTAVYFAGGVDIFFVISGFIMYAIAAGDFGKPGAARQFVVRRLVRIVPPYWIFTTLMLAAAVLFSHHVTHAALSLDHVLASYFFIPHNNPYGQAYPLLILGWTLNYEFFFYAVFAVSLCFARRAGLLLLFGIIGGASILGLADVPQTQPWLYWSNPIMTEFLFGIALAMAYQRGVRVPQLAGWGLVAAGVVAMVVLKQLDIAEHYWGARMLWMGLPALAICAGVVLAEQASAAVVGPLKALLVLLGDASYALYLSHPFSLNAVALLWARTGLQRPWLYVAVACCASLVVGVLVHLWIEKPMTRYLNGRVARLMGKPGVLARKPT